MTTEEKSSDLFKKLHDAVVAFEEERVAELCRQVLDEGVDAYDAIMQGLAAGMDTVGQLYEQKEYFVPELLLCSDALYAGLEILRPHIRSDATQAAGKIILGVVEGDIHDIGKTLVKTMFEAAGWEIYDLGKDVKLGHLSKSWSERTPTSWPCPPDDHQHAGHAQGDRVAACEKAEVIIMLGGAPLNMEIAKQYGADGYASDAVSAVHETERLLAAAA